MNTHTEHPLHTHQVSYCLAGSTYVHKAVGSHAELVAFADNTIGLDNELAQVWTSPYFKRSGIAPIPRMYTYFCISPLAEHGLLGPMQSMQPMEKSERGSVSVAAHVVRTYPTVSIHRNREHERMYVMLADACNVTCTKTGISAAVRLATPLGMNLETLHPFAFFSNVAEQVRAYVKQGLHLEKHMERQVLAGMLITALRHHKLLRSNDFVSANIALQRAKSETLSYMVRFFVYAKSTKSMPALRLVPEALYDEVYIPTGMSKEACFADRVEIMLLNYMKLCRGEGEGETRHTSVEQRVKPSGTVRIYGGNLSIESRQAHASQKHAYLLLEKLDTETHNSGKFIEWLESQVDAFSFLGTDKRVDISNRIRAHFGEQKTAKELARIFGSVKTETIEQGLENRTDAGNTQPVRRFNLTSKLVKQEGIE